jgi:hypothetical protein
MTPPANNLSTAAQIARAASLTRQAVHAGLERTAPAQAGPPAAWRFADLPLDWQLEITRRGVKRGFENGEAFLASLPLVPWSAPLPWDRVPSKEQAKAVKLQKALARALALRGDGATPAGQAEAAGLADFKTQFGYLISARHWRRLLLRTVERDGGEENWQRLEIYLDDRAFATPTPKRDVLRNEYQHRELDEMLSTLENRQNPTVEDRKFLWDAVFHHYEHHTDELTDTPQGNRERRLFRASLVHYLFQAFPERTLCATKPSLKRRFGEKLIQWRAGGRTPGALEDKRHVESGRFRSIRFEEDSTKILERASRLDWDINRAFELLLAEGKLSIFAKDLKALWERAILHDGSISLAYRLLHEEGKFSREFCEFYPYDVRTAKSEVPAAVRDAVAPLVKMSLALRRGPWQAKMEGPYIQGEHLEAPGDWFCADDLCWNGYFRDQRPDGRWRILRGECLLMSDYRTGYPLDFLLIAGHYNGEHVRSLVLRVHDRIGLPRFGFKFENGVWKSRLVVGDNLQGTPVHWRETENGLRSAELKLEVRHARARNPRGKATLEGSLRILQERMRCIPGFIGFNERTDKREREQELIARANNGDMEALRQFPTQAEWAATISKVLERFANDPQNGETLQGKSPAEAWAEEVRNRPLRRLPDEIRYILSTHRKEITVRQEGIILTIRGRRRIYFNEHTGLLIGRRVLAFYNLEMPELLTVSDMDRKNYFTVRAVKLPAMTATREQLAEANRLRKAHMAPARSIFGGIKHEVVSTITRDNEQGEQARDLGRFHNEAMAQAKAQDAERGRKMRKLQVKAARAGVELAGVVRNPDDALEAIDRRAHFLQAMREEEALSGNHSQEKP